jgi:cyclophilin family peptidyl-prolyl cis-trans isomerase/HEAT repeat protein
VAVLASGVALAAWAVTSPAAEAPGAAGAAPAAAERGTLRAIAIAEDLRSDAGGAIAGALASPSPVVRRRAALAAGRLQDSTWVPRLLPMLADADPEARREAVFALGQIGHRSARAGLEPLLGDADVETRGLATEALGKVGDRAATAAVARLLADPSPAVRGHAAVALWRLADSTALDALLARHTEPDPDVRWRVLYALEKIVNPDRIVLIAAMHLDDEAWAVRAHAARTIDRQRSARGTAYLLQALDDAEPAVVVNAVRGLQAIADSGCVRCGPSIARRLAHPHPYVRSIAATALGARFAWAAADSAGRRAMTDSLLRHLADPDAATRGACAGALLARDGEGAFDRVRPLLADSSIYVRVAVLGALATLPAAAARPLLEPRLAPGTPLFERMTAAEGIGALGARDLAPALRQGLADPQLLFAAACASGLAAMRDSSSVPALARAYAARGADADADARIAIRDALRSLAGGGFADSVERAHPAAAAPTDHPADFADPPRERGAVLHTTAGEIEWAFAPEEAPQTVRNFVRLARRGYFDGTAFHRVVPNFVIQDGDPTGTGSGGPGWTIRCEYNRLRYEPGMVGMALSGKDTGGSQWFITHSHQPHLNGRYTVFARVTRGMDVVHRIVQGDRITRVEILN